MSKKKRTRPFADVIAMIMRKERMPVTGANYAVKSNPSNMDDTSAHVLDYK